MEKPNAFNIQYIQTYVVFSSAPLLRFYMPGLDDQKLNQVWNKLKEITHKYSPKLTYNDLMIISRNREGYRVDLILLDKRTLLDYGNLKSEVKRWLAKNALALPSRIITIFLLPEVLQEDYSRMLDYVNRSVDELNGRLKEYYDSDDFKDLINTIDKVRDKKKDTVYERMYINKPRVYLNKVVYEIVPGSPTERYVRDTLRHEVETFLINTIKMNANVKSMDLFRRKVLTQVEKLEDLTGLDGLKDDVEKVLVTQDIDVLKKSLGDVVNRWI
jgi:hypothetical protein